MSRLTCKILPSNKRLSYTYDSLGRLSHIESSDGTIDDQYLYAQGNEPVQILDNLHNRALYRAYNLFGQLVEETNSCGLHCKWQYDDQGRCMSFTLPDSSRIDYLYEGKHLHTVQRIGALGRLLYSHTYDAFDVNGHVSDETFLKQAGHLITTHDVLERPMSQTSSLHKQQISYGLSGLVTYVSNSLFGDKNLGYDALDQLIQEGAKQYHFDSLGNPVDAAVGSAGQLLSKEGLTITYNQDGNPIKINGLEGPVHYSYDALGRLISITYENRKIDYAYDSLSRLLFAESYLKESDTWIPAGTRYFLYDRDFEIGMLGERGELQQLKVLGLGLKGDIRAAVAVEIEDTPFAPLHDFNGNIIALVDERGKIKENYDIDAFGRERSSSDKPKNPWRFSSKRYEEDLVFYGLRFYHPVLGRFLTPDPSGFADGANLYLFVRNNPLNRLDLFGLNSAPFLPPDFRIEVSYLHPGFFLGQLRHCTIYINERTVDGLTCCSFFFKMKFTPEDRLLGKVDIAAHFHELIPKTGSSVGLITYQNGICTNFNEFKRDCEAIRSYNTEGTLFLGMHSPTKTLPFDLGDVSREILYKEFGFIGSLEKEYETSSIANTHQIQVGLSEGVHSVNPDAKWLHIAHSKAGLTGFCAIMGMNEGQQEKIKKQMIWCGIGPAHCMNQEWVFSAVDAYSEKDYITKRCAPKMGDPAYNVRILPCLSKISERTGYFADHRFMGPTYQQFIRDYFKEMDTKYGFYNGNLR